MNQAKCNRGEKGISSKPSPPPILLVQHTTLRFQNLSRSVANKPSTTIIPIPLDIAPNTTTYGSKSSPSNLTVPACVRRMLSMWNNNWQQLLRGKKPQPAMLLLHASSSPRYIAFNRLAQQSTVRCIYIRATSTTTTTRRGMLREKTISHIVKSTPTSTTLPAARGHLQCRKWRRKFRTYLSKYFPFPYVNPPPPTSTIYLSTNTICIVYIF